MPRKKLEALPIAHRGGLVNKAFGPVAEEFGNEICPLGKEVGAVGLRAARVLLQPVSGLVWGFERMEEWIANSIAPKIGKIPPQFRVEPKLIIAGPAIESMKYCGSEPHLRDMFANLLATSMDARVSSKAHPAFVEIVKQLSPDEARILSFMAKGFREDIPIIEVYRSWDTVEKDSDGKAVVQSARAFGPYARVGFYAGCADVRQMPTYLSNLSRLEILKIELPQEINSLDLEDLMDDEMIKKIRTQINSDGPPGFHMRFQTGYIGLTPLGEQFFDACVRARQQCE
jgi:hypothetical protein